MQITIDIPDDIATTVQDKLPQILALGLREMNANPNNGFSGLTEILHFLAKLPSPQEVLNLRLAPDAQQEIDNLLEKNRTQGFNESDRLLWQHYEFIEHLVRLAKTQALIKLQTSQ
ncbi:MULTISPECIES: hypothetical protein [unclassified Pseudanabaena]|uniref:hypothetical protein n=1 Tax=unclassified Pseudanabaena TaxID=2593292 RepID=UPI0006D84F27|nr:MULTISPECIES: hypothetical protein [unclassified Pseudanabaena]TYQ30204.1 hypothetical protein PseudUWO310_09915 [Pseudanabaena sp. UWO310]